ncbi:MAG: hypothetical protein ACJARD_000746 [Alphaproteobacteria bacterium]|jgi:hypothetical protein
MAQRNILQSFDKIQKKPTINLETELTKIQNTQEKKYAEQFEVEKNTLHATLSKEYAQKNQDDRRKIQKEYNAKYLNDLKNLKQDFDATHNQYMMHYAEIIDYFLQHHLQFLNKKIINTQITHIITKSIRDNMNYKITLTANPKTIEEIQTKDDAVQGEQILYIPDEAQEDYAIIINCASGGKYICLQTVMEEINDALLTLTGIDFNSSLSQE